MYKRIPKSFINDIVDRINLIDYISQYANLKRVGQKGESSAKCPLPSHKDDTPSFYVNEHKQTFNCHGCGAGGGIVNFIKEYHGLEFVPAIEEIANFLNVTVPYESSSKKNEFISYSDVYHNIYNAAKTVLIDSTERQPGTDKISNETLNEVGVISVQPSLIRNVSQKVKSKDIKVYENIVSNLPEEDIYYSMLPIRTHYSDTIECLYLFNKEDKCFLPSKPARGFDKLVYSSHRYSKTKPIKNIVVLPTPVIALQYQSEYPNTAVIASIENPINLNVKALSPFIDNEGYLKTDSLCFAVDIEEEGVTPILEHYLRLSSEYAARVKFNFYSGPPSPKHDFDELTYVDLFNAVLETKFPEVKNLDESDQEEFSRQVEYLLGGKCLDNNLHNRIRLEAYKNFGAEALYSKHNDFNYVKPSANVVFEQLAVKEDDLKEIKGIVNSVISQSMDYDSSEIKDYISKIKEQHSGKQSKLLDVCLTNLEILSYKSGFIRYESFIDNLTREQKEAYMTPLVDHQDILKI